MKKHLRMLCILLCLVLCLSLVMSSAVIYGTHGHNCIGEDCHICQAISIVKDILNGNAFLGGIAFIFGLALSAGILISLFEKSLRHLSLIKEKVKLTI